MPKRGFFYDLTDQLENNANVHRELIAQIERITKRNLVCYIANPGHPGGAIQDHDPDLLENTIYSLKLNEYGNKIDLLINSPGGFPYAAGKMVKVFRTYSKEFRTIVVNRAMSAATLLCLGCDELIMAETASLGPIDPQIVRGTQSDQRLVPAQVIIDSFRQMLAAAQQAIANNQPPDPFLHVLDSLDVTAVLESMKAVDSTKTIAENLLETGLLKSDAQKIETVVKALMTEGEKELHGKHLYPDALTHHIGIPVTVLPRESNLNHLLRELFVRIEIYAGRKGVAKCLVTRQGGIDVMVEKRRI